MTQTRLTRLPPDIRRAHIISIATRVFLDQGYAATTMSSVARDVGGSKGTLYRYFKDKNELFEAVIRQKSQRIFSDIQEKLAECDVESEGLFQIGLSIFENITTKESIALHRLIIGDCSKFPIIGTYFNEFVIKLIKSLLEEEIKISYSQYNWNIDNLSQASNEFISLLLGEYYLKLISGIADVGYNFNVSAHITRVLNIFYCTWTLP